MANLKRLTEQELVKMKAEIKEVEELRKDIALEACSMFTSNEAINEVVYKEIKEGKHAGSFIGVHRNQLEGQPVRNVSLTYIEGQEVTQFQYYPTNHIMKTQIIGDHKEFMAAGTKIHGLYKVPGDKNDLEGLSLINYFNDEVHSVIYNANRRGVRECHLLRFNGLEIDHEEASYIGIDEKKICNGFPGFVQNMIAGATALGHKITDDSGFSICK